MPITLKNKKTGKVIKLVKKQRPSPRTFKRKKIA